MTITPTKLAGCYIIVPKVFKDDRGYFFESYNHASFEKALSLKINFVQDNQAYSQRGVLRGLHFQRGEHAQAKLIRVLQGSVLDIAVDMRVNSPTYKEHVAIELTADNKKQLFIPRGFAHGYLVLSETADILYKCDNIYNPKSEGGIRYDDPELNIDWKFPKASLILSKKDDKLPYLTDAIL